MPIFSEDISKRFMIEEFGQYIDNQEALYSGGPLGDDQPARTVAQELVTPVGGHPGVSGGPLAAPGFYSGPVSCQLDYGRSPPCFKLTLTESNSGLNTGIRYALNVVPGIFYGGRS